MDPKLSQNRNNINNGLEMGVGDSEFFIRNLNSMLPQSPNHFRKLEYTILFQHYIHALVLELRDNFAYKVLSFIGFLTECEPISVINLAKFKKMIRALFTRIISSF